jgi:hypothetical protein
MTQRILPVMAGIALAASYVAQVAVQTAILNASSDPTLELYREINPFASEI